MKPFAGNFNKPIPQLARLPTNKQVFGTKPGSSMSRNSYRPTPMSVQNSAPSNFRHNQNIFQNTPKLTFASGELFNSEIDTEADAYPNYYEEQYEEQPTEITQDKTENFPITASAIHHI